jgi:hypothetical protein
MEINKKHQENLSLEKDLVNNTKECGKKLVNFKNENDNILKNKSTE